MTTLPPEVIAQAREAGGGWYYEVVGDVDVEGGVPDEMVRGAWRIDEDGALTDEYVANPGFRSARPVSRCPLHRSPPRRT